MARYVWAKLISRVQRLYDMLYKPSELAEELGVSTQTVLRSYLPGGAPFMRDKENNIWIHGASFSAWALKVKANRKLGSLADGEAWCMKCMKPVKLVKPRRRHLGRYTAVYQGRCEVCNCVISRAYAASRPPEDVSIEEVKYGG